MKKVKVKKTKKAVKKKPSPPSQPPNKVQSTFKPWTEERVQALYKMYANTPGTSKLPDGTSTHFDSPHEWEWEKEPLMAPICLACNARGDYVEDLESGFISERQDPFEEWSEDWNEDWSDYGF